MMNVRTGPGNLQRRWRPVAWLALVMFLSNPVLALAQAGGDGKEMLSAGDKLRLSVPGRPDLDREVVLDALGQVTLEPVGSVKLGGLSREDATQLLKRKLRLFYPTLDSIQITVVSEEGKVRVYVIGSVSQKGVLNFETTPTLWDVVRAIGGPLENANLREARIIREENGAPQVHPVDLSGYMVGGDVPNFVMRDGDTLIVPSLKEGIPGVRSSDGVKVFGSVGVPTIVPIVEGTPLMDVLMLAGAPTENANKQKIYWVHNDGSRNHSQVVDLERYLLVGDPRSNPLVYPGDTISVEYKKPSWVRQNVPFILGSLAAIATVALAYDSIVNNN